MVDVFLGLRVARTAVDNYLELSRIISEHAMSSEGISTCSRKVLPHGLPLQTKPLVIPGLTLKNISNSGRMIGDLGVVYRERRGERAAGAEGAERVSTHLPLFTVSGWFFMGSAPFSLADRRVAKMAGGTRRNWVVWGAALCGRFWTMND